VDLGAWHLLPMRALLFGEAQGRVVVSTSEPARVLAVAKVHGVPAREIGRVRGAGEPLRVRVGARTFEAPLDRLASAYHDAIPRIMERSVAVAVASAVEDSLTRPVA
jgi:hypothetical protein